MTRRKSATPKERVLALWPSVIAIQREGVWTIEPYSVAKELGRGDTARQAWADAAKRLRGKQ